MPLIVEVPRTLEEWTLETLTPLLERGFESESFDFKKQLPPPADEGGKRRLRKAVAAFANRSGGFLIFGVDDDRALPVNDRLVGIESTDDFPMNFGPYASGCEPTVYWAFKNPAIELRAGRVLHVIHIPQSWKAPHAVRTHQESGFVFPTRTNQGDEPMSYSEVQAMFLGYYEKRLKLQLLMAELSQIALDANGMIISEAKNDGTVYGLPTVEVRLLETVLSDTYSITSASPELLSTLANIRSLANRTNNKLSVFRLEVALPMSNKKTIVIDHNDFIRPLCQEIIEDAEKACSLLEAILN